MIVQFVFRIFSRAGSSDDVFGTRFIIVKPNSGALVPSDENTDVVGAFHKKKQQQIVINIYPVIAKITENCMYLELV